MITQSISEEEGIVRLCLDILFYQFFGISDAQLLTEFVTRLPVLRAFCIIPDSTHRINSREFASTFAF